MTDPTLSLARYAEIRALLRHEGDDAKERVLSRLKLSPEQWAAIDAHWSKAIETDMANERGELVMAFAERFSETQARLKQGNAELPEPEAPTPMKNPPVVGAPKELSMTSGVDFQRMFSTILPFDPNAKPESLPLPPVQKAPPALTGTADLNIHDIVSSILPFDKDKQADSTLELTLEQYASLSAELAIHPENKAEVRARYFVSSDEALSRLDTLWKHRFAGDPSLASRWRQLYDEYHRWLNQQRG